MCAVKVSSKYQVVLPEPVRTVLGIKPGEKVEVITKGRIAYIVPVPGLKELQDQLEGRLDNKKLREKKDRK
ncbi:MAG: AbrB/MazE/SpoVT family DNA-binding domain-containing protein [Oligoflexia bacterium]|nr:AbrB/MazE/SpoVT family DNA-binding domain-containing protein [Oligoflexia bacterium]